MTLKILNNILTANKNLKIDKVFLFVIIFITIIGFIIFSSASLGLLARDGATFGSVASKQLISLVVGIFAFFIMAMIPYKNLKKYSFYIFIGALFINLLLFIPIFSLDHGGASRWIDLRFITFQPSEFLKIAFIIYFAAWLSSVKEKVSNPRYGIIPYMILFSILSLLLLSQSDTDTLLVISSTGIFMLFAAGGRIKDIATIGAVLFFLVLMVIAFRPYARQRVMTFFDSSSNSQGSGYQIQQSLLAIGSGGFSGRGFGQSIQKFNYLPEPIGDSIFAVQAEEFGFVGSVCLILIFLFFLFKTMKISIRTEDSFGRLLVLGIAILIVVESFMNISSMLGLIPLSGMPLMFISHGGTALIIALGAVGIIANVSKYQKPI